MRAWRLRVSQSAQHRASVLSCISSLFFLPVAASAATTATPQPHINDTGVTRCLDANDQWTADCAGSGQDAAYGRDAQPNSNKDGAAGFSFVKLCANGARAGTPGCERNAPPGSGPQDWSCVVDRVTGLTWEVKLNDGSDRDVARKYTSGGNPWGYETADQLVDRMNAAGLCGFTDWRVPYYNELTTLQHYAITPPAPTIDPKFFASTGIDNRYLSVSLGSGDQSARSVASFSGSLGDTIILTWEPAYVRLVRGPVSFFSGATALPGNLILDPLANIVWKRCPEGSRPDPRGGGAWCIKPPVYTDWRGALALAAAAGPGWRLPSIAELSAWTTVEGEMGLPDVAVHRGDYWSNTPAAEGLGAEGGIWVAGAAISLRYLSPPDALKQVRLVRDVKR